MPVITFESAHLTKEQKRAAAKGFTETATQVTGLPPQSIYVFIKESDADNVAVGGTLLSDM